MLFKSHEMGEVSFYLIGTNGSYVSGDNERFAGEGYAKIFGLKISQRAYKSTIFPRSTNDIIDNDDVTNCMSWAASKNRLNRHLLYSFGVTCRTGATHVRVSFWYIYQSSCEVTT